MAKTIRAKKDTKREGPSGPSRPHGGPPDTLRYVEDLPASVLRDMRTADPELSPLEPEPMAADLVRLAILVVKEIKRAAVETGEGNHTRLAFAERRNELTGAWGIVVCRQNESGSLSRPLAELLTKDDELTPNAKGNSDALGWCASNRRLSLVAYREPSKEHPRRFVMLGGRFRCRRRDKRTIAYLARILVTPFEVAQWTEPDERWLQ